MQIYRSKDGDMLDHICWKHYGDRAGAVEAMFEANPGLADHGPVLTAGIEITLPDLPTKTTPTVRLWD